MTHEEIRHLLSTDCTEEKLELIRCPNCGDAVTFYVLPERRRFYIRCNSDSTHMSMHGENTSSPDWWRKYVISEGWLS
jgi:hypothetical protein